MRKPSVMLRSGQTGGTLSEGREVDRIASTEKVAKTSGRAERARICNEMGRSLRFLRATPTAVETKILKPRNAT